METVHEEFSCGVFACIEKKTKIVFVVHKVFSTFAIASAHIVLPDAREQPMGGALHIRRRY